jgi:ATP-dependent exoDNAse (exonuclease V) beta subunit
MSQTEKSYREFGCQGMSIILQNGLAIEDLIYGNDGPAGFFKKLSDGIFAEPLNRSIQASTCAEKWYSKSSPLKSDIQALAIELMPVMQHAIEFYESNNTAYYTAKVILKNLFTLGILIDLSKLADAWCSENNTFLLPEAPVFLNKIIDGNDTPFIYEKAGYWFHHFMIDEFQDTSLMQWLNFKPLISNSLSQNYDNLAVGDTKQSIYRWRNSNWDILESRVHGDFPNGIIDSVTLNENWRSLPEIIRFNNDFFKAAASCLQEAFEQILSKCRDDIRDELQPITGLYAAVEQKPGKPANKGGYVKVEYISNGDDSGFYDEVNSRVVKLINDLLDLGYHMNDIAILTRKNSEAARLADYILENAQTGNKRRIEVISDEALHLNSSVVVNTLIALLQYILDPSDKTNNFYLASFSSNYLSSAPEASWMNPEFKERIPVLRLPQEFHELADTGKSYSLIEITERIIKIFELETHIGESVYLMAFRDMVIDYSKRSGSDVSRFIDYWNESGCERSVSAPAGQDAVRILTLHKSKGLEFKITIIPYCTWELSTYNKSFLWCRPAEEPFNGLPLIPLNFTSLLDKTIFAADYYKEIQKQYIDNLNLMYVAFTRAREAMFVFCKSGEKDQLRTVSDLSRKILGNSLYVRGELASNQMSDQEKIESSPIQGGLSDSGGISSITGRIRIAFQGELLIDPAVSKPSRPLNEGKILHDIFKSIQKRSDIGVAVTTMHLQGKIAADEQAKYISLISHAMNDIQVSTWFTDEWKILNEAEIILPEGIIKRPDRVMFNDRQTLVIDYKFGNKMESSYESQLREYASLLKNMGYKNVEAYLWYVRLGKIISLR